MSTILKWAGNKTAIMSELKKHLPAGPRLVEPFAGSCAVMMETDYPSYLVADINPDLINLYKKVAADCEAFISRARALFEEANREVAYYNIRQEFNYSTEITDFMKAVYFLYLNRHGYRGLCRYNKSGHFNIPYGNYKNPYFPEKEIRAFAEKAQRATFICASFDETLAMLKVGDVVYCDPPYDGTFSGYHTDEHAQVVGIDNGAFSAWVRGLKINWSDFYKWLLNYYHHPKVAFFVIPDVVDGGERDNDALINEVPKMFYGKATPVWHLHESIDRLIELCREWPRVCFGSSGEYAAIRTAHWHRRMQDAFEAIYCRHNFKTAVHGLRMLDGRVLGNYPLATADSTNLACNVPKFNSKYPELTRAIQEAEYSRNLTEKELKAVILKNRCAILKGAIEAVRPPSVSDWLSNGLQPSQLELEIA